MVMADSTADNVYFLEDRIRLDMLKGHILDFCRFVWPDGKLDDARYLIDPDLAPKAHVCVGGFVEGDIGMAYDGAGERVGTVLEMMRRMKLAPDPGKVARWFVDRLPPADPGTRQAPLGDFMIPAIDYVGRPVRPQEWAVKGWLPLGTVTSLYGSGGLGKSLLALHLCNAVGTGRPFFGLETTQGKAMMIACEESDDRLAERQVNVTEQMGIPMECTGLVHLKARAGEQNQMAVAGANDGAIQLTGLFSEMREYARRIRPTVLVIDNIAQVFHGNENSRPQVTAFCNALNGIAVELNCAVLLLGHPGKSSESEYSGSTAWDAAVRSRWYLGRPKDGGLDMDEEIDPGQSDLRVLRKAKANYSSSGDEIKLVYDRDANAFRMDTPEIMDTVDRIEAGVREREETERFMAGLRRALDQGLDPCISPNAAAGYAPRLLHARVPECRGMAVRTLERIIKRLWDAGEVVRGYGEGPPSRRAKIIVPKGHPLAAPPAYNRNNGSQSTNSS